ncbi:MAG: hypothetical protein ABI612_07035 [Betaproteobacteria bacterium]
MPSPETDPLFDRMSSWGRSKLQELQAAGTNLRNNFRATPDDAPTALAASADYLDLLDSLDSALPGTAVAPAATGAVTPDDAAQTGLLLQVDRDGGLRRIQLGDAAKQLAAGLPLVIGGAGDTLSSLVGDVFASGAAMGGNGMLVQYVGIDRTQFDPATALVRLEPNLLKTAALQMLNSALNEVGHHSTVVSHGFACWVVNRALRALPETLVAYAQNLQLDAMGPVEALQDLVTAKQDGLGAICHVQTSEGRDALVRDYQVPQTMLAQLPVDIGAPAQ